MRNTRTVKRLYLIRRQQFVWVRQSVHGYWRRGFYVLENNVKCVWVLRPCLHSFKQNVLSECTSLCAAPHGEHFRTDRAGAVRKNINSNTSCGMQRIAAFFETVKPSIHGGADRSLARPTSRCRRTESIVSLERGVCSCVELQVFSSYRGWKEACQATGEISTTWRRALSSIIFFSARPVAERNSRHFVRNIRGICTIVCHRQNVSGPD